MKPEEMLERMAAAFDEAVDENPPDWNLPLRAALRELVEMHRKGRVVEVAAIGSSVLAITELDL